MLVLVQQILPQTLLENFALWRALLLQQLYTISSIGRFKVWDRYLQVSLEILSHYLPFVDTDIFTGKCYAWQVGKPDAPFIPSKLQTLDSVRDAEFWTNFSKNLAMQLIILMLFLYKMFPVLDVMLSWLLYPCSFWFVVTSILFNFIGMSLKSCLLSVRFIVITRLMKKSVVLLSLLSLVINIVHIVSCIHCLLSVHLNVCFLFNPD